MKRAHFDENVAQEEAAANGRMALLMEVWRFFQQTLWQELSSWQQKARRRM